jgi:hypothetical protein
MNHYDMAQFRSNYRAWTKRISFRLSEVGRSYSPLLQEVKTLNITSEYIKSNTDYWWSRTDGKPICADCAFSNRYNKRCNIGINGGTAKYPISCNQYKRANNYA